MLPPGKYNEFTMDGFSLFFDNDIIYIILQYTSMEVQRVATDQWKPINAIEIYAFTCLVTYAGLA